MKTFRFRDFPLYTDARHFRKRVCDVLKTFPANERYRLVDQIHRSCLSVILNIAEGSAKKSDIDFARFLEMAISSVNEVIAGFDVAVDEKYITTEKQRELECEAENLAKQLGGFMKKLRLSKQTRE